MVAREVPDTENKPEMKCPSCGSKITDDFLTACADIKLSEMRSKGGKERQAGISKSQRSSYAKKGWETRREKEAK